MDLIIYNYIDHNGFDRVAIGDMKFMKRGLQTSRQLVKYLGREMSEEERADMVERDQQKLLKALLNSLEQNQDKVFYPN